MKKKILYLPTIFLFILCFFTISCNTPSKPFIIIENSTVIKLDLNEELFNKEEEIIVKNYNYFDVIDFSYIDDAYSYVEVTKISNQIFIVSARKVGNCKIQLFSSEAREPRIIYIDIIDSSNS